MAYLSPNAKAFGVVALCTVVQKQRMWTLELSFIPGGSHLSNVILCACELIPLRNKLK